MSARLNPTNSPEHGPSRSLAQLRTGGAADAPKTPTDALRKQLVSMAGEFRMALPSHVTPEKFQRVVMTVAQQTPELLEADRRSLLGACMKCAADGLLPDGREAALVIFNSKSRDGGWEKKVQYMPMLAGLLKRARNSGEIAGVSVQVIHENDEFVQTPDDFDKPLLHRPPTLGQPRGKAIGAYALAKLKDGTVMAEVMDREQIDKVRSVSRAKDKGPWVDWWDQMARKTVFRRLSKYLPMDADIEHVARRDDALGQIGGDAEAAPNAVVLDAEPAPAEPRKPLLNAELRLIETPASLWRDELTRELDAIHDEDTLRDWMLGMEPITAEDDKPAVGEAAAARRDAMAAGGSA